MSTLVFEMSVDVTAGAVVCGSELSLENEVLKETFIWGMREASRGGLCNEDGDIEETKAGGNDDAMEDFNAAF